MGHVVRDTLRSLTDVNTTTGQVIFQQRWQYFWRLAPKQPNWTQKEREFFHRRADLNIWNIWSNRATFVVKGSSDFARRFEGRQLTVNFDIKWVLANPHWSVFVYKAPPGWKEIRTRVEWTARQIYLKTIDFISTSHAGGVIAHEFGHSMDNTWVLSRRDEYKDTSPHKGDTASVMNVGSELRRRHFRTAIEELNKMIPNTVWSIGMLK